jgi:hypothetical protein
VVVENRLGDKMQPTLVPPWLWRAVVIVLALVVIMGGTTALWLGTRPALTGAAIPVPYLGRWTFGPGAAGEEADGSITVRATGQASGLFYAVSEQPLVDFVLEARAVPLSGPDDTGYGLIVRYRGLDDFVALLIGPDGYIAVGQMSGGKWRWRVPWQPWPHIKRGSAENLLRAQCRTDRCRFYVNGEFAFEVSGVPGEGQTGFAVWNPEGSNASAAFREWQAWR